MTPDPAAVNLTAARSQRMGVPVSLGMVTVFGESEFDLYAEGDNGTSHGLIQVHLPAHGRDRSWWVGLAGAERSFDLMQQQWIDAWNDLGRDVARWHRDPVGFLNDFWPAAQGADPAHVRLRAPLAVQGGMTIYRDWFRKQKPMNTIPRPPIVWIGCAAHNYAKGRNARIGYEGICKHTTAGGTYIEDLDHWFNSVNYDRNGNLITGSTPFGLGRSRANNQPAVHQYVDLADTAIAQGQRAGYTSGELFDENAGISANLWLIGEEHVDGGTPGNHDQGVLELGVWLDAWLFQEVLFKSTAVPTPTISRRHIVGHYQADGRDRPFCPSWPESRYDWHIGRVNAMLFDASPEPPKPPEPGNDRKWIDYLTAEMQGHEENAARLRKIHGEVNDLVAAELYRAQHIKGILDAV